MSRRSNIVGKSGEDAAAEYLAEQGYEILRRNFKAGRGELDIVCTKGGKIYFVEVKTRKTDSTVSPIEAVTPDKRRRLYEAAVLWLQKNGLGEAECSFLLLTVASAGDGKEVRVTDVIEDFLLW